jgi:hypothetical protein
MVVTPQLQGADRGDAIYCCGSGRCFGAKAHVIDIKATHQRLYPSCCDRELLYRIDRIERGISIRGLCVESIAIAMIPFEIYRLAVRIPDRAPASPCRPVPGGLTGTAAREDMREIGCRDQTGLWRNNSATAAESKTARSSTIEARVVARRDPENAFGHRRSGGNHTWVGAIARRRKELVAFDVTCAW